jgi:hypothetical protein
MPSFAEQGGKRRSSIPRRIIGQDAPGPLIRLLWCPLPASVH